MTGSEAVPPSVHVEVLRGRSKVGVVLGVALLLGVAVLIFRGLFTQDDLSVGSKIIGSFFGVLFGGMGLLFAIDLPGILGRHRLVFDRDGLAYEVSRSWVKPFRVHWSELETVRVNTATRNDRTNHSTLVRLDMTPVDPDGFASLHPDMAKMRAGNVWRLPLGPNSYDIEPVSAAVRNYAGPRGRDIDDEGGATGWTYR